MYEPSVLLGNSTTVSSGPIYKGAAGAVTERAPIDCGMTALQDRVENLHRLVSTLEQRFGGVLRAAPPSVNATRPIEVMAGSPIGSLLCDRIGQMRDLEARIEDILSRCEL